MRSNLTRAKIASFMSVCLLSACSAEVMPNAGDESEDFDVGAAEWATSLPAKISVVTCKNSSADYRFSWARVKNTANRKKVAELQVGSVSFEGSVGSKSTSNKIATNLEVSNSVIYLGARKNFLDPKTTTKIYPTCTGATESNSHSSVPDVKAEYQCSYCLTTKPPAKKVSLAGQRCLSRSSSSGMVFYTATLAGGFMSAVRTLKTKLDSPPTYTLGTAKAMLNVISSLAKRLGYPSTDALLAAKTVKIDPEYLESAYEQFQQAFNDVKIPIINHHGVDQYIGDNYFFDVQELAQSVVDSCIAAHCSAVEQEFRN